MAADQPAAIGDLADDLLARVFAAVWNPSIDKEKPMRDRCSLPQVGRRWRAVAASPAAAPVWARVEIGDLAEPAADPDRYSSLPGWFAVHGARVRSLALWNESEDAPRAWEAARAVVAMAPGVAELTIDCVSPPPAGLEWRRTLARGITHLDLWGGGLDAFEEGAPLPPSLLELKLGVIGQLPPALAGLARLTRLEVSDIGGASEEEAASDEFWQVLGGLRALRFLAFHRDELKRVPAAVGALTALTHLAIGSHAMSAPGALDPLASLSRLEALKFRADGLRRPSALAGLTSLRELSLRYYYFGNAEAPIVEAGPHLAGLRVLALELRNTSNLADVPRRVVEPLRAATALTELAFHANASPNGAASCLLLTADRVEALLASKPALRRVHVAQQMRLEEDGANFAALGRRHPRIEFSLPVRARPTDRWYR